MPNPDGSKTWDELDPTNLPGGGTPFSPSSSPRTGLPDNMHRTGAGSAGEYGTYTPNAVTDPNYAYNRHLIGSELARTQNLPNRSITASTAAGSTAAGTMAAGAQSSGATIDQIKQAQFRDQQSQLGNALMAQANGQGPSVAGSQLQQSTEMNLQAALAQAASNRGGNLGAAQYQLGNARANIQQQAAQQLAQTRIQEQMAARSQLGDVLNSGRGADIGLATSQAGMNLQNNQFNAGLSQGNNQFNASQGQQNNQFNAGMIQGNQQFNAGQTQSAAGQNLTAGVAQDQNRADNIQKLIAMGYSMDQANVMLGVQQGQFNAQQLNTAEAARHGIAVQQNGQNMQAAGAIAGGVATAAAALL